MRSHEGYLGSAVTSATTSIYGSELARDAMSSASSDEGIDAAQAGFYLSSGLIGTLDSVNESSNIGDYFNI